MKKLKFYLDENVPKSVLDVIIEHGHEGTFIRDVIPTGSPDTLVGIAAVRDSAILISHDSDFKKIATRIPEGSRSSFKKLSIVRMECQKPQSSQRFKTALPYIEFDARRHGKKTDKRVMISVTKALIRIER